MIENILLFLYISLAVVVTYFIVWLTRNLMIATQERDEWRVLAVDTNTQLQNLEQLVYCENKITKYRDTLLRPFRTSTQLTWSKSMQSGIASTNRNKGE